MTYQQSLENIKNILNFVSPLGDATIVFDFTTPTEFQIRFVHNPYWYDTVLERRAKNKAGLPYAVMEIRSDEPGGLGYMDPIVFCTVDIITGEILSSDIQELCFSNVIKAQSEFLELIRQLKQM